jgi:hypothetical protein
VALLPIGIAKWGGSVATLHSIHTLSVKNLIIMILLARYDASEPGSLSDGRYQALVSIAFADAILTTQTAYSLSVDASGTFTQRIHSSFADL